MTMSAPAQRVLRVLQESGSRALNVVDGLVGGTRRDMYAVVGELFVFGVVRWIGKKRGRRLASVGRKT